jgi:MinD-like ATPase involved in chromosome partitioning or flagellar assembly
VFVVTSSGINEGKSSIVVNVGICLEKMGYSVLLIDNDIRLPSLERHFGLKVKKSGFIHFAEKDISFEKSIIVPSEDTPCLHLAVPGKSSVVSSLGYTNYLDNETLLNLRGTYDYILIDVPPFEFVSEQIALIELADALLISTR